MTSNQNTAEYGWGDVKVTLRSRWPLALLIGSFVFLVGAWMTWKKPGVYESTSEVMISNARNTSPVLGSSSEVRPTALSAIHRAESSMKSGKLLLEVAGTCDLMNRWHQSSRADTLHLLREQLEIQTDPESGIIKIRAKDVTSDGSSSLANAVAESFHSMEEKRVRSIEEQKVRNLEAELRLRRENKRNIEQRLVELNETANPAPSFEGGEVQDLRSRLVSETHLIRSLEARHQLALVDLQNVSSGASILRLSVPENATQLDPRALRMLLYGAFGLLIGCATTLLISIGKSPIELASDLSRQLDLQLMAFAPVGFPLLATTDVEEEWIEPYRDLRNKLHRLPAADSSVVLFLPCGEESHCDEVVAQTAAVIANSGHNVLVIDGNFRDPHLHLHFEAARHPGLADFLSGEMRIEETVVKTRVKNLWFMPSGPLPGDPGALVNGKRMDDLFWEMKGRFDYVLVTAPSIHQFSDAGAISAFADHVVLVTSYHNHKVSRLRKAKHAVEACRANLSGVVLSQEFQNPRAKLSEPTKSVVPLGPVQFGSSLF
jgi:capsular exopolysaccharide synthesis family protein